LKKKENRHLDNMNQFYDINDMDFVIHWNVKKMEFDDVLKSIKIGNILHKGVLSEVYEGFSYTQNKRIAIKIFEKKGKTSKQRKMIEKEINIALKLNHPNIVKVHTVMEDKERVYIVMDYLGKYNLKSYSNKRLKEEKSSFSKEEIYSITHDLVHQLLAHHALLPPPHHPQQHHVLQGQGCLDRLWLGFVSHWHEEEEGLRDAGLHGARDAQRRGLQWDDDRYLVLGRWALQADLWQVSIRAE
jgi:hypothetical protein